VNSQNIRGKVDNNIKNKAEHLMYYHILKQAVGVLILNLRKLLPDAIATWRIQQVSNK
jgi:hypothetical protein